MADENIPSSTGFNKPSAIPTESEKILAAARKTPKSSRSGEDESGAARKSIQEKARLKEIAEELNRLYAPENFAPIVSAPANILKLVTGSKIFDLPSDEVNSMATTASLSAKYFMVSDPKWVALTMFFISVSTTYGMRIAMYANEKRKEKKEDDKK